MKGFYKIVYRDRGVFITISNSFDHGLQSIKRAEKQIYVATLQLGFSTTYFIEPVFYRMGKS